MELRKAREAAHRSDTSDGRELSSWVAFALALWLGIFALGQALIPPSGDASPAPAPQLATAPPVPARPAPAAVSAPPPAPTPAVLSQGTLHKGQTLASSLASHGITPDIVHAVATGLSPIFDFRYARPGDHYRLGLDASGQVVSFEYDRSPLERYMLERKGDELVAERHEPKVKTEVARVAGVVSTSLYDAITALGESGELAHDFAQIFAWDVDFSRAVQPGDEFRIVYERRYLAGKGEDRYLGPGRILAARYTTADQDYNAIYYQTSEGHGGYYRLNGSSVERQFLRAPLNYIRISSRYSTSRLHPILKVRRPHHGVDYAAPTGTPVWSVADGTVIFRGRDGGFGNAVKVRHANGYVTLYGHLSRFRAGLRVGQKVRQKQVIGYVGMTGLATGPHLHFRVQKYGRDINPALIQAPPGHPIPPEYLADFRATRDAMLHELDPTPLQVVAHEAGG